MRKRPPTLAGRLLGLVTVTATTLVLGALPASAEPPVHDTSSTAQAITAMPFSETVDTTEATTDAEDAALNERCGAPATNGSVWYTFVAADVFAYTVDLSQSDFAAGVILTTGTPGNLTIFGCAPERVSFQPTAGETVYLMVFSTVPEVVGGQLAISLTAHEAPPDVSMTVDDVGRVDRETGVATVSGTYTCVGEAPDYAYVEGRLQQQQGEVQVTGNFDQYPLKCGGTFEWSAQVTPENGKFRRGLAATAAATVGCNEIACDFYNTVEVIRLR